MSSDNKCFYAITLCRYPQIHLGETGFAIAVIAAILAYQMPSWNRAICVLSILAIILNIIAIAYYIYHLIIDAEEEIRRSKPVKLHSCDLRIIMIPFHGSLARERIGQWKNTPRQESNGQPKLSHE